MGKVFGALRPCLSPYRDERQMNLSYMVLLDMWNMFGQKFLSFIGGYIFKKICQGTLYEFSVLQGSILCPYSNGTENSRFWIL